MLQPVLQRREQLVQLDAFNVVWGDYVQEAHHTVPAWQQMDPLRNELARIGFGQEFGWDSCPNVRSVLILIHIDALPVRHWGHHTLGG